MDERGVISGLASGEAFARALAAFHRFNMRKCSTDLRHPEHRHHRVADELLHRPLVRLDDRLHPLEVAGEHPLQGLRVDRIAQRRRAHDIAEEDGDDLAMHSRIIARQWCERKSAYAVS
jgi:hypothetical protein